MADFKDQFSPAVVKATAAHLRKAWPAFPDKRFVREATAGLEELELMARVRHIAAALAKTLPPTFPEGAAVVDKALDSPDLTGWMTLPLGTYVAEQGLDDPEVALPLLAKLTPRWSSEATIRPFIERHPKLTFKYLHRWAVDPDEHVRRLVSEGTRPRLPWAPRLRGLMADPAPAIALLDLLVEDPSEYVRRSVANHLNDIVKDHPELALKCARRWHASGSRNATWVVRHGMRTLVKQGHPEALALLGFDHAHEVTLDTLKVTPQKIAIGDEVTLDFTLSARQEPVRAAIDYLVHYAGARGTRKPRVFKLTARTLPVGAPQRITRKHRFENVSIRTIHPGPHLIEIQVNGAVLGGVTVEVAERGQAVAGRKAARKG